MEIPCSWPLHIRSSIANELRLYNTSDTQSDAYYGRRSFAALWAAHMLLMVRPSHEIIYPVISTDINAKHSIAHSHAWDTGRIYVVLI